jgi:NhaC family Na+:H+ antiporter
MSGVLGVPTIEYLPYAFFNIVNPLVALLFGFTGIGVERLPKESVGMQPGLAATPAQPTSGRPRVE